MNMSKLTTKYLKGLLIRDALSVAYGFYSGNAQGSAGYAFTKAKSGKEVEYGHFVWQNRDYGKLSYPTYDGYIDYKDKTLLDTRSGELRSLEDYV